MLHTVAQCNCYFIIIIYNTFINYLINMGNCSRYVFWEIVASLVLLNNRCALCVFPKDPLFLGECIKII